MNGNDMNARLPLPLHDYLDSLDVDWESLEHRLGKEVRRCFAAAAMEAVVERVRQSLIEQPRTQVEIAEMVNVDRTSITHFLGGGGINLQHFLLLLTEYGMDLDVLCPDAERAVAGYLAAMPLIRRRAFGRRDGARLDRAQFFSLCYMWSSCEWRDASIGGRRPGLQLAASRIRRQLHEEAGIELSPDFSVQYLKQVMADWGAAWIVCLRLIPHRWGF
jgi:hypothetical protein